MENALLILHIVLVLFLIVVVLIQRSEGGALGMGGGGGGVVTGRGATSALQKVTWYIAIGFIATSLALTVIATTKRQSTSVFDGTASTIDDSVPAGDGLAPPTIGGDIFDNLVLPGAGGSAPATGGGALPGNLTPASE